MRHAFVDIANKTMCSRCGQEVKRVDEECPMPSDGELYARLRCPACGGIGQHHINCALNAPTSS